MIGRKEVVIKEVGENVTTLLQEAGAKLQEIGTHKPPLILKTRLTSHIRPKQVSGV